MDKDIKNEVPNDIEGFIKKNKKLKLICFNGTAAKKYFYKYFSHCDDGKIDFALLPSSSPIPTKSAKTAADKFDAWRVIRKYLSEEKW